jgi:hypothetical protein
MLANEKTFDIIFNKENKAGHKPIDIAEEKVIELQVQGLNKKNATKESFWAIFDHLDTLSRSIEENTIKIGDTLI